MIQPYTNFSGSEVGQNYLQAPQTQGYIENHLTPHFVICF